MKLSCSSRQTVNTQSALTFFAWQYQTSLLCITVCHKFCWFIHSEITLSCSKWISEMASRCRCCSMSSQGAVLKLSPRGALPFVELTKIQRHIIILLLLLLYHNNVFNLIHLNWRPLFMLCQFSELQLHFLHW